MISYIGVLWKIEKYNNVIIKERGRYIPKGRYLLFHIFNND